MNTFTRQFNAFLTVARLGNFTRAAAKLAISQSTLTVQIRNLEETLGIKLFDRNRRQVSLTVAGRGLLTPVENIVEQIESLISSTRDEGALRRGVVSIAALPSIAGGLLAPAVAAFSGTNPGIKVRIQDVVAQQVVELVKAGDVDFGIGSLVRADRDIVTEALGVDELWAFIHRHHELATKSFFRLTDLQKVPLITTTRDSSVRRLFDKAADRAGLVFTPVFETHYMSTALALARARLGAAILPQSALTAAGDDDLAAVPIRRPTIERKLVLIRKAGRTLPRAAALLVDELRRSKAR